MTMTTPAGDGDERILQFGAGRFLRGFFDRFVQEAGDAGQSVGRVVVVQSTAGRRAELLRDHPEGFQVLLRGVRDERLVDNACRVASIGRALSAATDWAEVLELAKSPALRFVVSNATESGYVLVDGDAADASPPATLPAKLARVLFERFRAGGEPLTMLPCELIEQNATRLLELVVTQARRWDYPDDFHRWMTHDCLWLNSLVDCIITDAPADHPLAASDPLLICAEPYRLWAIEKPPGREVGLFSHPDIHLVDDLAPYYLRKVRILNGTHTALTAKFLPMGYETVYEVVTRPESARWVRDLMYEEIVPTLIGGVEGVARFADDTFDRYRNPHSNHLLVNIAVNHADKARVRLWPTRDEYARLYGRPPARIAEALAWAPA